MNTAMKFNLLSMTLARIIRRCLWGANKLEKTNSGLAASIVIVNLLAPSLAHAQYVIVSDTDVCADDLKINASTLADALVRAGAMQNVSILFGVHGSAEGDVKTERDSQFVTHALSQIATDFQRSNFKVQQYPVHAEDVKQIFIDAIRRSGPKDSIVLGWCNSEAWYNRVVSEVKGITRREFSKLRHTF
jgi:hypothetical protein